MNIFITTLGFLFVFSWLALRCYPKFGLMDRPQKYGLKRKPLPYPGGLAIFFAFLVAVIIYLPINSSTFAVLLAASILVAVSFIDDRFGLPPIFRLCVQFVSSGILVWGGMGITSITNPFGGSFALNTVTVFSDKIFLYSAILTIVWVMVMINAFNWVDGVPGMASSIAFVSFLILFLLSIRPGFHYLDQTLAISFALIGMALSVGFLFFDFPPPRMIMGDTGSMLLGFLLAVTAIISGGKIATTVLVLGFPILDFMWVIARRIYKKQSPFRGDLMHFHHRLLKAGFSEGKVVVFYAAAGIVFGSLALMLHTEGKFIAFIGILALMTVFGVVLYKK